MRIFLVERVRILRIEHELYPALERLHARLVEAFLSAPTHPVVETAHPLHRREVEERDVEGHRLANRNEGRLGRVVVFAWSVMDAAIEERLVEDGPQRLFDRGGTGLLEIEIGDVLEFLHDDASPAAASILLFAPENTS